MNGKLIKVLGIGATLLGVGGTLISGWVEDKKMDDKIKKEVNKALAAAQDKESA